jgi:hypothetical protein
MPSTHDLPREPLVRESYNARKRVSVEWVRGMANYWIQEYSGESDYYRGYRRALCQLLEEILHETDQYYSFNWLSERMQMETRNDGTYSVGDDTHRHYLSKDECEQENQFALKAEYERRTVKAITKIEREAKHKPKKKNREMALRLPAPTRDDEG